MPERMQRMQRDGKGNRNSNGNMLKYMEDQSSKMELKRPQKMLLYWKKYYSTKKNDED